MDISTLGWTDQHAPVGDQVVEQVEQELGVMLPADFIACAMRYHGGYPEVNQFDYVSDVNGQATSGFNELLSFDVKQRWNIVSQNKCPPEELPKGLIIFGTDGGGGYLCFDYRKDKDSPPVVFWSNDTGSAETVIPLAQNFSAFLEMLYEPRF